MSFRPVIISASLLIVNLLSACVSTGRNPGFPRLAKDVQGRTGIRMEESGEEPAQKIQPLLQEKLTAERAARIALVNNGMLRAELEELGVAKADLLQATLIKNPRFEGFARTGREGTDTEFSVSQDVISILLMPLKRRIAKAEFERARLRVTDAVITLAADAEIAFYEAQAAAQLRDLRKTALDAAGASAELAERQTQAGNLKALDFLNQQAAYEQSRLDLVRSEAEAVRTREAVNRLLGLSGNDAAAWKMESGMPALPVSDPPAADLEEEALARRLDLAAAREQIEVFRRSLIAARFGFLAGAEAGLSTEQDAAGERVTGPDWAAGIPIFDWGQAARDRAGARLRQSEYAASAFEVQVRSEVHAAASDLSAARSEAERYRDKIIPLREQILDLTQREYNFMLKGVYELIQARQNEILARQSYITSLKDYWIARVNLERAAGGTLARPPAQNSKAPPAGEDQPVHAMPDHEGGNR